MNLYRRRYPALVLLAMATTAGCGTGEEKRRATQVAAKVGSYEITVHQVNNVLARNQNIAPEAVPKAKREILDQLIDQQLAGQQAIARKLDRLPSVMQAISAAQSEILANAYFDRIAAEQPVPAAEEIKKYYAAHPELFAQRRIFTLEEIVALPVDGLADMLRQYMAKSRTMQEIAAWLKSQEAVYAENRGLRAAEQVPMDLLPQLHAMTVGEIRLIEGGGRLNVFRLVAVQPAPVDEPTAAPHIRQVLLNQRLAQAIAKEIAQLKKTSKLEYIGEFADAGPATAAKPAANTQPAQPAQPPGPDFAKGVRGVR